MVETNNNEPKGNCYNAIGTNILRDTEFQYLQQYNQ
ncbi:MAG: hypothetical protein MNSN_08150 [Minisyncoccus archaeiphilus]|nr:MAG: hypothetical protein MNSN_08150 [Candidatus Parcubacteria bacterium]